ncbi:MAG: hypothetical protein KIT02_10235 [Devosia sp.]|uniref:hypothetical protein n=1 Tax=Devosia sp. TaxID=1871048 RepID=UPI0024C64267|nr:hypothetical protein [Devosia sp.]UYN98344.1 MAG: hypothetical protein KIT02_10235 [Devosia sp.]
MIKSLLTAAISTLLLAGCATVQAPVKLTGVCPDLPAPTGQALDALEDAARADPDTAEWVIDLSQHYDALDRCGRPS